MQKAASRAECCFSGRRPECKGQLFQSNLGYGTQSMACSIQQRPEDVRLCRLKIASNLFLGAAAFFLDMR
jgi:hypothetical protein